MASIPNSALPFGDNAVNGQVVDQVAWNQLVTTLQNAINDNFARIVQQFNTLNADGSTNTSLNVNKTQGTSQVLQFEMGSGITINAIQNGGTITFTFSIANGAITESMLANGVLQDVFYTQTQLNSGQLNNLYYTKSQVDSEINSAAYSKTVQTGTSFPSSPTSGQEFYRTDLHALFVYDSGQGQWNQAGITYTAGTGIGITGSTISNSGVTSFNGMTGAVNYTPPATYNQLTSPNAWISQG